MTDSVDAIRQQPSASNRKIGLAVALILLLAVLVLGLAAAVVLYERAYADRVYLGVNVMGLGLGGLTRDQAQAVLAQRLGDYQEGRLLLRYGERAWPISPHELGVRLDAHATAVAVYAVGRHGTLLDDLRQQAEALWLGHTVRPVLEFDEGVATVFLSRLAGQINQPVRDAGLVIRDLRVQVIPSQMGREVDVAATRARLYEHIAGLSGGTVEVVVRETHPAIADAQAAQAQVERMIGRPLNLTFAEGGQRRWALDQVTIAGMLLIRQVKEPDGWVHLEADLDADRLRAWAQGLAAQIDQPPRDARFHFDPVTKTLSPTLTSQMGYTLDVTQTVALISQRVTGEDRNVALPVQITRPKVAVEDAGRLGIHDLVVEASTNFKGSSWGRMRNIQVAASRFDGVVVPPGEVFSFNEHLGEVSAATGYEASIIIWGNRSAVGIGGGVCQVSTTAFRAAFWGGFPIVERWAHGYRVGWYEPPVGLDATVYSPVVDFKFKNDTPGHLLIQTATDLSAGTVTFRFYGTPVSRTVEMEGPFEDNVIAHGPPIYEEDPTLPEGATRQIDWAHDGVDVTVRRIVKEGDEVLYRDTFFSRYKPWQAVYLVGTKKEGKEAKSEGG